MGTIKPNYICPVCGCTLEFAPWVGESAADEMCPCCGIQFGYNDAAGGDVSKRQTKYILWRENWICKGMKWHNQGIKPPSGWNPEEQLQNVLRT